MAVKMRVDVISREAVFRPGGGLSPAEVSARFAKFAAAQIAAIDADNAAAVGHALPRQTFVDGTESDNLSRVRPDGVIVAQWTLTTEVVRYVYDKIVATAPKLSGRFAKSQRIYADGVEVETPEQAVGAEEVVIASTVPYARKIEGGFSKTGGAWATNQNGVYHAVAAMASAKYGNIAKIKFGAREVLGGGTDLASWASGHSAMIAHEGKRRKQHAKDSRQPAVVISFR
jgi:hypothetical protein